MPCCLSSIAILTLLLSGCVSGRTPVDLSYFDYVRGHEDTDDKRVRYICSVDGCRILIGEENE